MLGSAPVLCVAYFLSWNGSHPCSLLLRDGFPPCCAVRCWAVLRKDSSCRAATTGQQKIKHGLQQLNTNCNFGSFRWRQRPPCTMLLRGACKLLCSLLNIRIKLITRDTHDSMFGPFRWRERPPCILLLRGVSKLLGSLLHFSIELVTKGQHDSTFEPFRWRVRPPCTLLRGGLQAARFLVAFQH